MDDQKAGIETEKSPGAGVAFFSLEMSADQLATRILAEQAEITSEALRSGKITRDEFQKLSFASQRLAELEAEKKALAAKIATSR
jgi:replicative DNA helicase